MRVVNLICIHTRRKFNLTFFQRDCCIGAVTGEVDNAYEEISEEATPINQDYINRFYSMPQSEPVFNIDLTPPTMSRSPINIERLATRLMYGSSRNAYEQI